MKNKKYIAVCALAAILCLMLMPTTGCRTTGGVGGGTNYVSVWEDPTFISKTAVSLEATVANEVAIAVTEDGTAATYAFLVKQELTKIKGGVDYTPDTIEKSIQAIRVNGLKGKYANIAIANISLLYTVYWNQIIGDNVNVDPIAAKLIQAAIDGISLGLAGNAPTAVPSPIGAQSYRLMKK